MKFLPVFATFASLLSVGILTLSAHQIGGLRSEIAAIRSDLSDLKTERTELSGTNDAAPSKRALIRGWAVRIFEAPKHRNSPKSVNATAYAGAFIHTGSWISLDEYKKHEGIFLSGEAALNLRGEFHPRKTSDYVFAVHMKMLPESENSLEKAPTVSCYTRLMDGKGTEILRGKMLVDGVRAKGALIADQPINISSNEHRKLDFSFVCDGKPRLDGAKIMFRLCVRKASDPSFRPLVPSLRV